MAGPAVAEVALTAVRTTVAVLGGGGEVGVGDDVGVALGLTGIGEGVTSVGVALGTGVAVEVKVGVSVGLSLGWPAAWAGAGVATGEVTFCSAAVAAQLIKKPSDIARASQLKYFIDRSKVGGLTG